MTAEEEPCIRVLVPAGVLGWGVRADEIAAGLDLKPHAIAVDAGSTDSGPAYLATGRSKYGRQSVKRDLSILMDARRRAGIPLRIALLYSEQSPKDLKVRNANGKVKPLAPSAALRDDSLEACSHIVALMGPEPYIAAIDAGADIVLGGRTTDTAVLAALPLMRGAN